jgi:tRNA pseudouridine55 synthase
MQGQLNGIIVIDKPAGMSSAKVVRYVKKLFQASKAGHAGTLDPFATGVLVCCINQATRLARFFLHGKKTYEAVLRLGVETDTQDQTGCIVNQMQVPEISRTWLEAVLKTFEGHQMQTPPVYSALKHQGTPLYKLARQGKPVQKPARSIAIETIRLLDMILPEVRFEVTCSAGTYVRSLCADIGRAVGCGGHLARLRRTAGSGFSIDEAVPLAGLDTLDRQALQKQTLIPMAAALRKMAVLKADAEILQRVSQGQKITQEQVPLSAIIASGKDAGTEFVKVVDDGNNLKAVLQMAPNGIDYNYCCVFH